MADDDLERFAQGLSAAGSYQPTRPAVSVAAPSASPDPDMFARMIARGQAREAEIDQMSPLRRFFGGNLEKSEIMDRLPKLEAMRRGIVTEELKAKTEARQAETQRFQQESESRKFLLEKFDKLYGMSPEQRATAGPIYAEVIGDLLGRSNAKNAEVLKPLITKVFSNPDLGKQLRDIFDDPAFEPDLPGLTALFATQEVSKWPELREKAVEKAQKRWDALVASNLKTLVDETRQELGKTSVNAQDLIASAQRRFGAYAKSPIVQQAFIGRINSLTPEQQIELGMVPGKIQLGAQQKAADVLALAEPKVAAAAASTAGEIKRAEEAVTGPKVSQGVRDILAGQGVPPATATKEQLEAARRQARQEEKQQAVDVSKATGENAATIALQRQENEKLNEKAPLWIDPETGNSADPNLTHKEAKEQGYKPVTQGGLSATSTAKAALAQITEYRSLIKKLYPVGTGNTIVDLPMVQGNRAILATQYAAGSPDVRRLYALHGSIATLARATGDTANVAVAEREMLKNFVLTSAETQQSAKAVLDQAERILRAVVASHGVPLKSGSGDTGGPMKLKGQAKPAP